MVFVCATDSDLWREMGYWAVVVTYKEGKEVIRRWRMERMDLTDEESPTKCEFWT